MIIQRTKIVETSGKHLEILKTKYCSLHRRFGFWICLRRHGLVYIEERKQSGSMDSGKTSGYMTYPRF